LHKLSQHAFKERAIGIISEFFTDFWRSVLWLPLASLRHLLSGQLLLFLPRKIDHIYHQLAHRRLLKMLDQTSVPPFHGAFLWTLNKHFDVLFLPEPLQLLLDVVNSFLKSICMEHFQHPPPFPRYLFRVMMLMISSKNVGLIELVNVVLGRHVMMPSIRDRPNPILAEFTALPCSFPEMLKQMMDQPAVSQAIATLAILLFPIIDATTAEQTEAWFAIFFRAFESPAILANTVSFLYTSCVHRFSVLVSQLNDHMRTRLVTLLSTSLVKLPPVAVEYAKILLSKIPAVAISRSRVIVDGQAAHSLVDINHQSLAVGVFVPALMNENSSEPEKLTFLCQMLRNHLLAVSCYEAIGAKIDSQIAEHLAKHDVNLLDHLFRELPAPACYAALFFVRNSGLQSIL
jgi:hypothetical protein